MSPQSRTIAAGAAAVLVLVAAGGGVALLMSHKPAPRTAAADGRRLTLELGRADTRADTSRPIRCFVDGRNVGDLSIALCAQKNGVDARSLDLGLDRSGVLSAGQDVALTPAPRLDLTAPPVLQPVVIPELQAANAVSPAGGPASTLGACLDYETGAWRSVGEELPLGACVRRLFDGRCERPGGALYGRWADRTVRLVPGRIEVSSDNRNFRTLASQGPGCSLPPA